MDALIVLAVGMVAVLAFDALVFGFGQDSRSMGSDDWDRPWALNARGPVEG